MKVASVVTHTPTNGKLTRWCIRCGLHLNEKLEIDLDYYTARQYLAIVNKLKFANACDHMSERPMPKEELIKQVDISFHSGQANLIKEIIRRLP